MPTITLTETDTNQSFSVHLGDQIVVRLDENPTTGYRWAIDQIDEDLLVPEQDDFSMAGTGVGGGGELIKKFTAKKPGSTRLGLKLWRDWEGDKSIIKRFDAVINVN
jgi:inhibitor of cysteine peptidase